MIKRTVGALLAILLTLSLILPVYASASPSEPLVREYFRAPVTVWSDEYDTEGFVDLMITKSPDRVYVNAEQLAGVLGLEYAYTKVDCTFVDRDSSTAVMFKLNANAASVYVLDSYMSYELPYNTEYIDGVVFIPFSMALALLYCDFLEFGGNLVINKAGLNAVTGLSRMLHEIDDLRFDYISEIGGDEATLGVMSASSKVVNFLSGLITFERKSWGLPLSCISAAFEGDVSEVELHPFIASYVSDAANMFVNVSEAEGKRMVDISKRTGDILDASDVPIGIAEKALGAAAGSIPTDVVEIIEKGVEPSKLISVFNQNKRTVAKLTKGKELAHLLPGALSDLNKARHGLTTLYEIFTYAGRFEDAEQFGVDSLKLYSSLSDYYVGDELDDFVTDYESGTFELMKRCLSENSGTFISGFVNWGSLIGGPGAFLLPVWSIVKDTVPFFKDGLDHTGNFLLHEYSALLMDDARIYLARAHKKTFGGSEVDEWGLYDMVKLGYAYLKFSYIAREAAAGSLELSPDSPAVTRLEHKNERLSEYLEVFAKCGKPYELFSGYGLLPSKNAEFVKSLNDTALSERLRSVELTKIEGSYSVADPIDEYSPFPGGNGVNLDITEEQALKLVKRSVFRDYSFLFELDYFKDIYDFAVYTKVYDDPRLGYYYVIALGVYGTYDTSTVFCVPFDGSAVYIGSPYNGHFMVYTGLDLLHDSYLDMLFEVFELSALLAKGASGATDAELMEMFEGNFSINGSFTPGGGDGGGGGSYGGRLWGLAPPTPPQVGGGTSTQTPFRFLPRHPLFHSADAAPISPLLTAPHRGARQLGELAKPIAEPRIGGTVAAQLWGGTCGSAFESSWFPPTSGEREGAPAPSHVKSKLLKGKEK